MPLKPSVTLSLYYANVTVGTAVRVSSVAGVYQSASDHVVGQDGAGVFAVRLKLLLTSQSYTVLKLTVAV